MGGDFNEVLNEEEKKGGLPSSQGQMNSFREAINHCGLHDLQYSRYTYTWSNGRSGDNNV